MASENVLVGAVEFGISVWQRVKILAHAGKTDNVMSCVVYPAIHFDNRSVIYVLSWFLFVDDFGDCLEHVSGLGPKDGIQVLHMTVLKCRYQIPPLYFFIFQTLVIRYFRFLCKVFYLQHSHAENATQASNHCLGLDKVIIFMNRYFC